jgi:hypothetical protein
MASTTYIRPTGVGDETSISAQYPDSTYHYDKVDEETSDDAATTVSESGSAFLRDLYDLADLIYLGTINYIKVWMRINGGNATCAAKTSIKTGGTVYNGSSVSSSGAWLNSSTQYTNFPGVGGGAWTWEQINALQAGVCLLGDPVKVLSMVCTQVWVEINWNPSHINIIED